MFMIIFNITEEFVAADRRARNLQEVEDSRVQDRPRHGLPPPARRTRDQHKHKHMRISICAETLHAYPQHHEDYTSCHARGRRRRCARGARLSAPLGLGRHLDGWSAHKGFDNVAVEVRCLNLLQKLRGVVQRFSPRARGLLIRARISPEVNTCALRDGRRMVPSGRCSWRRWPSTCRNVVSLCASYRLEKNAIDTTSDI